MNAEQMVRKEIAKNYDGDFIITSMQLYSNGIVVLFTVGDEHRVAYFQHISIMTDKDTLVKKWDFIA